MSKKLVELVNAECSVNVGKYNFSKDKEKKLLHHNICKQIKEYAEQNGMPYTIIVYVAIGCDAHRPEVFGKGYTKFDEARLKRVIKMARYFVSHFGLARKSANNDRLVHTICRYDNLFANRGKFGFFKGCVDAHDGSQSIRMSDYKTAKDLGKFIFGENLQYNDRGYFVTNEGVAEVEEVADVVEVAEVAVAN